MNVQPLQLRLNSSPVGLSFGSELRSSLVYGEKELEKLQRTWVLIVGQGRVGSNMSIGFADGGVGRLTLIDPETVETKNIPSSPYRLEDLGKPKVKVIGELIKARCPDVKVDTIVDRIENVPQNLIFDPTVCVVCVDNLRVRGYVNQIRCSLRKYTKPIVQVGFWEYNVGLLITLPTLTACWTCLGRGEGSPTPSRLGPTVPRYIADLAVNEVLKLLIWREMGEPPVLHYYEANLRTWNERKRFLNDPQRPDSGCRVCGGSS